MTTACRNYDTRLRDLERDVHHLKTAHQRRRFFPALGASPNLIASQLIAIAARAYGVSIIEVRGRTRSTAVAKARYAAIWLIYHHLDLSTKQIGRAFDRDHSTVIHALQTTRRRFDERSGPDREILHDLARQAAGLVEVLRSELNRNE